MLESGDSLMYLSATSEEFAAGPQSLQKALLLLQPFVLSGTEKHQLPV
jgi:hypothetical protein